MASNAQITANQLNAQHSTGPRTAEGKAASALNALKHGLTAQQVVIPGEDPAAYDELRQSLIDAYRPANEVEAMLVESVTRNWWKLQRAMRIEARIMSELGPEAIFLDDKAAKMWNNFLRYRNSIERAWKFAVTELKRLVTARQKRDAEIAASAAFTTRLAARRHPEPQPPAQPVGSVSSPRCTTARANC